MVKLEQLITLDKSSVVDIRYCNIVSDDTDEDKNRRRRILEQDGRYYFHEMIDGEVTRCCEIAVDWKPANGRTQFAFTPDDRHIYYLREGMNLDFEVKRLDRKQIKPGDSCTYRGMELEILDEQHLQLNSVVVPVVEDSGYTYKLEQKRIKASGAAVGLYIFLENIAEHERAGTLPLFSGAWDKIFTYYNAKEG